MEAGRMTRAVLEVFYYISNFLYFDVKPRGNKPHPLFLALPYFGWKA
jgi:hypothetical protein